MISNYQRFTTTIKQKPSNETELTIVILGGGVSPRKKFQGAKSLIPVGTNSNVFEMQSDSIKTAFPKADTILVTGFQSQQVVSKRYPVKILENQSYEETSDVEEVRIALNATLSSKILFMGGDLVIDAESLNNINTHGSCIMFDDKKPENDNDVGITHNNNVLENIGYMLPNRFLHCVYLEGKELEILRKFVRNKQKSKLLFFEAINFVAANGGLIRAIPQVHGNMYRIGV